MTTIPGVHEKTTAPDNGRTPAEVMARFPGARIFNVFTGAALTTVQDLRPRFDTEMAKFIPLAPPSGEPPIIVIYRVKTAVADTRNGLWNARFQELGAHIAAYMAAHNIVVIFVWWHEPEDDMNGTAFAHAQNKVRQFIKTGGPNVLCGWACMAYQWAPKPSNPSQSIANKTDDVAAWQSVETDILFADAYNGRSFPLDQILPEHPGIARWLELIVGDRDFAISERGFETPNSATGATHNTVANYPLRNETITREIGWLENSPVGQRCKYYVYWNSSGTEASSALKLDPTGEDTLAAGIASLVDTTPPPPPEPTEEELQQAYDNGYAAGRASRQTEVDAQYGSGFVAGRAQGRVEGEEAQSVALLNQLAQLLAASTPTYPS